MRICARNSAMEEDRLASVQNNATRCCAVIGASAGRGGCEGIVSATRRGDLGMNGSSKEGRGEGTLRKFSAGMC